MFKERIRLDRPSRLAWWAPARGSGGPALLPHARFGPRRPSSWGLSVHCSARCWRFVLVEFRRGVPIATSPLRQEFGPPDLRYTYDPVGRITQIRDGAQQTVYFDNAVVSPDQRFEYDPLYRLTHAEGREHTSLTQPTHADLSFGPVLAGAPSRAALPSLPPAPHRFGEQRRSPRACSHVSTFRSKALRITVPSHFAEALALEHPTVAPSAPILGDQSRMSASDQRFLDVVQGLCDEGGRLLHLADGVALVATPDRLTALVLSAEQRTPDELESMLRSFAKRTRRVSSALVLIGGERPHRDALARAQPRVMIGRVVQVFMLGDDRQPWAGPSSRLDSPVGAALSAASTREHARHIDVEALRATIDPNEAVAGLPEDSHSALPAVLTHPRSYATPALLAGCVIVFMLEERWGGAEVTPTLVRMGAGGSTGLGAEPWRLISSSWLHIGPSHLALNLIGLAMLGWLLEPWLGWRRLVLLHLASTLGTGVASAMVIGDGYSAGASGAVFGLLGSAVVLAWRRGSVIPATKVRRIRRQLTIYALYNLAASTLPGIDLLGHVGGGLVGVLLTYS